MKNLLFDLRQSLRLFGRTPGFAVTATLTLGLGVAAVVTVFSILQAVVLRPLPYAEPDQLVMLWSENPATGVSRAGTAYATVQDWKSRSRMFSDFAVFDQTTQIVQAAGQAPRRSTTVLASPELFAILGVAPAMGRLPTEVEVESRAPVVVISHLTWRRMEGTARVLGRTLLVGGRPMEIIGVLPEGFQFHDADAEIWQSIALARDWPEIRTRRGMESLRVIGRLAPRATLESAQVEMNGIAAALRQAYPADHAGLGVRLVPLAVEIAGPQLRTSLYTLAAGVCGLLLIACSNVANLMVARNLARQREFAVRLSLGASRGRLIRQLILENLMLGLAAAMVGVGLAEAVLPLIRAFGPNDIPRLGEARIGGGIIGLAVLVTLGCAVLFGLGSAWGAMKRNPLAGLRDGGRGATAGPQARRLRSALVVVELALAVGLLAGAGLLGRSLVRLLEVDPGFRTERVLVAGTVFPSFRPIEDVVPFVTRLREAVSTLPGVTAAGVSEEVLLGPRRDQTLTVEQVTPGRERETRLPLNVDAVSPGFFETMGVRLRQGRDFDPRDDAGSEPVAVINETLARRLWSDGPVVGRRVRRGGGTYNPWLTVVGVVADTRRQGLDRDPIAQLFRPYAQEPSRPLKLVLRTVNDPTSLASSVAATVRRLDPEVPEMEMTTLDAQMREQYAPRRFHTFLLAVFAVMALLLASVGIFGLMHYSVLCRKQEIGVRMALGARPAEIRHMILGEGMGLAGRGMLAGIVAALIGLRAVSGLLFGISSLDPVAFGTAIGLLAAVTWVACYLPARRASRMSPTMLLRDQ